MLSCWSVAPTASGPVCRTESKGTPPGAFIRAMWKDCRVNRQSGSQLLTMMALVALVVAMVILIFFGIGYLFGRLFL